MQLRKVSQFLSLNFFILKSLHDSFIIKINATNYISFKILDR